MENLTIENLERVSKNWDKKTKDIFLFINGSGNMFGGSSWSLHIVLHGDNSITETGAIEIKGVITSGNNISRGANGDNSASAQYYKGVTRFEDISEDKRTENIHITGICGGAFEALADKYSATKDWFIK